MNKTVIDFLEKNNIDPYNFNHDKYTIKSDGDINPILNMYSIPGKRVKKEVSIGNILGYSYDNIELGANLVDNLSRFFDAEGSGYEKRSIGMLTMNRDECVETLKDVSTKDTVYVRECENNKYIITTNGMHRYHVLRFHYLNELAKIDKTDKIQIKKLKEKYTIPVEVEQTDYIKTYSYFILKKYIPDISIRLEYDSQYERTGNSVVTVEDKQKVFTDEQLLSALRRVINNDKSVLDRYKNNFEFYMENLPSFRNFIEQNSLDLFSQEVSL